jgi:toxin ParE1/3/4
MRDLTFTPGALDDSIAARAWYESKREGLGAEFDNALEAALDRIHRLPETGKPIEPPFRRVALRRFPYEVFYEFDSHRVLVVLVFHTARDPASALARLQGH